MATEKVIKIVVDKQSADKEVTSLFSRLKNAKEEVLGLFKTMVKEEEKAIKTTEKVSDGVSNVGKASKTSNKDVSGLSKGFNTLGVSMKAAGIGYIVALVASLTLAFRSNQKIMDVVNTVMETVSIVMAKVATAMVNVYESVAQSSENFNGLISVLKGLVTIGFTPLRLAFNGIKLAVQETQLIWEQSFLGGNGKDKKRIAELQIGIIETKNNILELSKNAILAGKDVFNNFTDAVSEVVTIGSKVSDELGKISVKSAYEQAKVNVQVKNTAQLAAAQQQLLVEKYDILAEKQRQIRDEERNSITDRIKANNELGEVLNKQQKAMLAAADAQIAAAQNEVNKNKTIEAQVALIDALANKQGVLAQIEGFRSEQLVNDLALKREQIELDNTISDREKQRQLDKLEFEAELATKESDKNVKLQERLDLENEIILADLERKRELYAEGTLSRVEAEQDYLDAKQAIEQKQTTLTNKINEQILADEKKLSDDKIKLEEQVANAKESIANRTADLLIELAGKGSKIGKAIAVAQTIRSGIEGVQNAYSTAQKSPITALFPAYPIAQAGLAGAFSALQVKKILSTSDIGGSSNGGGQQPTNAPSFNLVQGTETNQIAQSINNQNNKPIQAYVTTGQVTTGQSLDRNKIDISSI